MSIRSSHGLHKIALISYSEDRLECSCGATMTANLGVAWSAHRRASGLTDARPSRRRRELRWSVKT